MSCAIYRSWSRDKSRPITAESDTEVEYSRRLNVRTASSEVTQGRSMTLQRQPYRPTTTNTTPATAAAAGDGGAIYSDDVIGDLRHHHRRQTSLPSSTTSGLF